MRILLLSQFFGPDSSAVGQFLSDVADGLAGAGHQVCIICGSSSYAGVEPCGGLSIAPTENSGKPGHAAVEMMRVANLPFSHRSSAKLLSYLTFYAGATWKAVSGPKPDVVLTLTAPPG